MKEKKEKHEAEQLQTNDEFKQFNENQNIFKQMFQFSPFSIIIHDMEMNILDVNLKAVEEFGYSKTEFLHMKVTDLHSKEELEHSLKVLETMKTEDNLSVETSFARKDGTLFYAEATPFKYKVGSKSLIHVYIQDVTQRKENEVKLVKAMKKAEESDRLKSAFLTNMSHEIRTPMNGILGFTQLLKYPGLNDKKKKEYLDIIEESGNRMISVIDDIISISKIETGLVETQTEPTDINKQFEFLATYFKPALENKELQLKFIIPPTKKKIVLVTDTEKLIAVLTNLIKNAIKYSEKGIIEAGYTIKENQLEFFVIDKGIGIPPERQSAIFERFIQADVLDKKAQQGSGLGLSISKAYVEMLGGKIWVKSKEGEGAAFYFTLPYHAEPETGMQTKPSLPTESLDAQLNTNAGLKILIAEDDEFSYSLLKIMLEGISREILHAPTGTDAVEISRNHPDIDLILMDIKMPGLSGYEATQQIRTFNKEVVIIAQTAFARGGDKIKAINSGCNAYISKPIKEEELQKIMKTYFTN